METDTGANVTAEKAEPALPLRKNMNEDTRVDNSPSSRDGTCGTTDVAKARWSLLRQVYLTSKGKHKPCITQTVMCEHLKFLYISNAECCGYK